MNSLQITNVPISASQDEYPISPTQQSQSSNGFSSSSSNLEKNSKEPCTIYKINLDFLNHKKYKVNQNFIMNQLCENSMRTIQRDISNYSSQFIFNDNNDTKPNMISIYQKIISSNNESNSEIEVNNIEGNSAEASSPEIIHLWINKYRKFVNK